MRYIYSGELEPLRPQVRLAQLVTAAAWLEIPGLITMCGQIMEKIVDVEELVEVLVVTEEWGLHSLGKVAVDLINRDRGRFIVNPVFQSLMMENPGCLLKLYQSLCYPESIEEGMSRKMMLRTCYRCGVSSYTTYCSWCQHLGSGPKE